MFKAAFLAIVKMPNITFNGSSFNIKPLETLHYNYWKDITKSLKKIQSLESAADVKIHCKGKQILRSSKFPLIAASKLLKSIFDSGCQCPLTSLEYDLVCPEFEALAMHKVLELIYSGYVRVDFTDQPLVLEISAILTNFGMNSLLQIFETIMIKEIPQHRNKNFNRALGFEQPIIGQQQVGRVNEETGNDELPESAEISPKSDTLDSCDKPIVMSYQCEECQKEFMCEEAFQKHKIKHTNRREENDFSMENFKQQLRETLSISTNDKSESALLMETIEFVERMPTFQNSQFPGNQDDEIALQDEDSRPRNLPMIPADDSLLLLNQHSQTPDLSENPLEDQPAMSANQNENITDKLPITTSGDNEDQEEGSLVIDTDSSGKSNNHGSVSDESAGQSSTKIQESDVTGSVHDSSISPDEFNLNDMSRNKNESSVLDNTNEPNLCRFCNRKFVKKGQLVRHISNVHYKSNLIRLNGGNKTECQFCNKVILSEMPTHLALKHGLLTKLGQESIAKTALTRPRLNSAHKMSNNNDSTGANSSLDLRIAEVSTAPGAPSDEIQPKSQDNIERGKEMIPCPTCNKVFSNRTIMNRHFGTVHNYKTLAKYFGKKEMDCGVCRRTFKRKSDLLSHLIVNHKVLESALMKSTEKDYTETAADVESKTRALCETKSRKVADKPVGSSLTKGALKTTQCPVCHKIFFSRKNARLHIGGKHYYKELKIHFGKNANECGLCKSKFTSKEHLILHLMGSRHNIFKNALAGLSDIDNKVPKQIRVEEVTKPPRSTPRKRCLETKTDEKNYYKKFKPNCCPLCSTRFITDKNLTVHASLVHYQDKISEVFITDTSLTCRFCSKETKTKSGLLTHLASKHDVLDYFWPKEERLAAFERAAEDERKRTEKEVEEQHQPLTKSNLDIVIKSDEQVDKNELPQLE